MNAGDSRAPLLIASAPNGAYKTRAEHAAIPLTAAELAAAAFEALTAGARMLHLHVRDAAGRHTLEAAAYAEAIAAIRARVGGELLLQCTSEAAGIYDAAAQRAAVGDILDLPGVDGISLAVRELAGGGGGGGDGDAGDPSRHPRSLLSGGGDAGAPSRHPRSLLSGGGGDGDVDAAAELFHRAAARGILAQYIVYTTADIARYADLLARGVIPAGQHSLLLVAGKKRGTGTGNRGDDGETAVDKLRRMLAAVPAGTAWMACAFGDGEFDCLTTAAKLGGHVRIGFENTLNLRDGRPAPNNRALIRQFTRATARPLANVTQARIALGAE